MSDPLNPFASPQADLTPSPGQQWAGVVSPELRQTQIGLSLVYFGIVLALFSVLIAAFGSVLVSGAGPGAIKLLLGAGGIGMLIGFIMMFIGPLFCLGVPGESGARGYIVASVLFQLANLAMALLPFFVSVMLPPSVTRVLSLVGLVGTFLFILFMKKLAEYIGREDLSRRAKNVMVALTVLVGLGIAAAVGTYLMMKVPPAGPRPAFTARPAFAISPIFFLGFGCFGLIVFVMYANLINALRKALGTE